MIYLDNAATTYPKPEEVYKALDEANRNSFNAGRGEYEVSKKAFKLIYDTRSRLGKLINVQAERVIFTSSAKTFSLPVPLYHCFRISRAFYSSFPL